MSAAERDEIAPPLAVFTSLFRYLLVTIHDTEFYDSINSGGGVVGVEGRKQQPNWMPFTLSELVPMSLSLRDVALGKCVRYFISVLYLFQTPAPASQNGGSSSSSSSPVQQGCYKNKF